MANLSTIEIRKSGRAKRLSLRANAKKSVVELVVPPRTLQFSINRFLKKHEDWITDRQNAFPSRIEIKDGARLHFKGKARTLVIQHHTKRTTDIALADGHITITTSRDDPTQNFKRWVIKQASDTITPLVHEKCDAINKQADKIDMRDTSSRWGSCSSDQRLMFSWRLIFAPPYVLDYVVAHEVAHLKHMDHSARFWDVCYALTDRADEARQWLKDNGNDLLAIF